MAGLAFGWDDSIDCIQPVAITGEQNEPLCLAHKTSKLFVGAGVWVRDDGYVLRREHDAHVFYPWDEAQVKQWQSEQLLPDPLPSYSISIGDYVFGYSLWLIVVGIIAVSLIKRALTKRRQARDALVPVSFGPPKLETDGDRFIADTVRPWFKEGEALQHQAVATPGIENTVHVWFVAFTNQRVFFINTERVPFRPKLENKGVEEVSRDRIHSATEMNREITLHFKEGGSFVFFVPKREKGFSNQVEFVRDVPRILSGTQVVTTGVQVLG